MGIAFDLACMVLMFGLGVGFGYFHVRSRYHRGCANFMGTCAQLIISGDFDEKNVVIAFGQNMPWQDHFNLDLWDRLQ